jgi:hypothetical protein
MLINPVPVVSHRANTSSMKSFVKSPFSCCFDEDEEYKAIYDVKSIPAEEQL